MALPLLAQALEGTYEVPAGIWSSAVAPTMLVVVGLLIVIVYIKVSPTDACVGLTTFWMVICGGGHQISV